jgi:hypothetical protein
VGGEDKMKFTLEAGPADLDDMATTFTKAMAADLFWTTMKGPLSFGEKLDFQRMNLWSRVNTGLELGVCRTFKVIDDNGCVPSPLPSNHVLLPPLKL